MICSFVLAFSFLVPRQTYANSSPPPPTPPPPPQESGRPENCTWPGVVTNSTSNKTIKIWWDTDEEPFVWKDANLQPGQNSTMYTCDADYYTY